MWSLVLAWAYLDFSTMPFAYISGPIFSYKLRYIVGFRLVEMAISTNQKLTIYGNLYENMGPVVWTACDYEHMNNS